MAEGQRPRKTKRKREKATPVNAEIQAAVEKERHAQSIARAKRNIEDIAQCNQYSDFYNANPSKSGDNVALTFIKKAVIYFFAAFSCVGIGANIAMMLLN